MKTILQPNPSSLSWLVGSTYLLAGHTLHHDAYRHDDLFRRHVWPTILTAVAFIFKISMAIEAGERVPLIFQHIPYAWSWAASLVTKARLSFAVTAAGLAWYSIQRIAFHSSEPWIFGAFGFLNLFLLGQTRYANIPLFLLFEGQRWMLEMVGGDKMWMAMTCLWMQHVSFFALGNSNSLSSIDLSNAYNGINSYSIPLVGMLTFISNWAGPIWWTVAAIRFLARKDGKDMEKKKGGDVDVYLDWMGWCSWFHGVVMCFLVATCIILRTHLFIWTVFSPKFLFQAVWLGLAHIVIQIIFGGTIWWIG